MHTARAANYAPSGRKTCAIPAQVVCVILFLWLFVANFDRDIVNFDHEITVDFALPEQSLLAPSDQRPLISERKNGVLTKVLVIYGTRPEAVKMAPVIKELRAMPDTFETVVCVTGQHREMLQQINGYFKIKPDIDLDLMQQNQSLPALSSVVMETVTQVLVNHRPHVVVVQGDTTTALIAALAAFYQQVPVAHVEAGLRTYSLYNPFPEEANRRLIGAIASYNFAATRRSQDALLGENVPAENIYVTGNTVIDSALWTASQPPTESVGRQLKELGLLDPRADSTRLILLTAHRRENWGTPMKAICEAALTIAENNPDVTIIFPVHLNPKVREVVFPILGSHSRVRLIDPLDYEALVHVLKRAYVIMTDSGGITEEATAFGVPSLVLRLTTDRPEGVLAGASRIIGSEKAGIIKAVQGLLDDGTLHRRMSSPRTVYGDGEAGRRIARLLAGMEYKPFAS